MKSTIFPRYQKLTRSCRGYLSTKSTLLAIGFTIFLAILEYQLFYIDYRTYFEIILDETGSKIQPFVRLAIHICLSAVPIVIYIRASLLSEGRIKLLYLAIFSLIAFIQYGYQSTLNSFMALHDLQTAVNSLQNWKDAITNYVNWQALIPTCTYALLLLLTRPAHPRRWSTLVGVTVFIFTFNTGIFLYTQTNSLESRLRVFISGPVISTQAFLRMLTVSSLEQVFAYRGSRETLSFQAESRPTNNVVLVIDESVRYDHLSLNGYKRSTTPYLEQLAQQGRLYNWGRAVSATTCTYQSVATLLTGVTDLPDTTYQIKQRPTIFQYARAMNYRTFYFDGQSQAPRPPLTDNDFAYIDEWHNQSQLGNNYRVDQAIATQVATILEASTGNFVLILKRGLHTPYNQNFPIEHPYWTPVLPGYQIFSPNRTELVNSYDNAMRYNLDSFFENLLTPPPVLENSVILYTSDHGQTLSDNGEQRSHCGNTPNEAAVPLFLITGRPVSPDTTYQAGHYNIFATVLDLMEYPTQHQPYIPASPSLLRATAAASPKRYFYQGPLYGFDDYQWIAFDE